MKQEQLNEPQKQCITVSGVTFSADDVVSAIIKIGGRKIHIAEQEQGQVSIGFSSLIPK